MVKRHGVDERSVGVVLVVFVEDTAMVPWHRRFSNDKNYIHVETGYVLQCKTETKQVRRFLSCTKSLKSPTKDKRTKSRTQAMAGPDLSA